MKWKLFFSLIFFLSINLSATYYYVNDNNTSGDIYCTAVGNDSNNGLATNTPKATITNLLSTYSLTNNDVVYIDTGTYNERVKITNKGTTGGYIMFIGAGISNSLINGTGGVSWNDGCITITNAEYIKIKNLKLNFYNDTIDCYGIYVKNSSNIIISNNLIISNRRSGIRLDNCSFSTVINNIVNYNNRAHDTWPAGIQLSSGSKFNFIKNNISISNARGIFLENTTNTISVSNSVLSNSYGIYIDSSSFENVFKNNTISFSISDGVDILTTGNYFTNNRIYNNNGFGIKVDNSNPNINRFKKNEIFSNSSFGVALYRGNNIFISNTVYGNTKGFELNWDATNSFLKGNIIYNNSSYGIDLLRSKNYISNNTIYNCSHGIHIGNNVSNTYIAKNEIYNSSYDGIAGEGGDHNVFISNNIHNNNNAGITLWNLTNSYNILFGNNIQNNSTAGINIIGEGNILRYNKIGSSGNWGIKLDGVNGAPLTNEFNISYDNTWEGILINNAGSGSLLKNCSLFGNGADGIEITNGSILVKNSLSVSNIGYGYKQSSGTMVVSYSVAYGNSSGAFDSAVISNSMITNPRFESTSPSSINFLELSGWSPCIDAGDPTDTGIGQGVIDIGAKEYILPGAPYITALSANELKINYELIIYGTGFQAEQYYSTVSFSNSINGKISVSEYLLWQDTYIKVKVPSGLSIGTLNSIIVKTRTGIAVTNDALRIVTVSTENNIPAENLVVWNNLITPDNSIAKIWINNENKLGNISVKVYTIYGKLVKDIINAPLNSISLPIEWDGTDNHGKRLASGVYLIYVEGYKYKKIKRIYIVR